MTKVSQITFFDGIYEVTMAAYVLKPGKFLVYQWYEDPFDMEPVTIGGKRVLTLSEVAELFAKCEQ